MNLYENWRYINFMIMIMIIIMIIMHVEAIKLGLVCWIEVATQYTARLPCASSKLVHTLSVTLAQLWTSTVGVHYPFHYHTWRKFPSSFVNERNHKMTQIFVKYILHLCIFCHLKLEIELAIPASNDEKWNSYTSISGSWHAPRPGSQRVNIIQKNSQKAVSTYLKSKKILHFGCALRNTEAQPAAIPLRGYS